MLEVVRSLIKGVEGLGPWVRGGMFSGVCAGAEVQTLACREIDIVSRKG
jgi:hypothetical protein